MGLCRGVELGDVERDGDLDMIFAQDFDKLPRLMINDGDGFFTDETVTRLPNMTLSASRAQFGDIDNDGDLDIYILDGGPNRFGCGQNRIYVNDGMGFFTDETDSRHPLGNLCEPMDCIFGDVDNDFDIDVRTASTASSNSRLFRNNGSGVFTTANTPPDNNCYSYDFGDIDNDGDLDLFGANGNAGGNNSDILLKNTGMGFTDSSSQISPNPTVDDNDSKFFDFDNDGDRDLIVARLGGTAERIYLNDGAGNFAEQTGLITPNGDSTLDVMVADLLGNGRYAIVTAQGESGLYHNRIYVMTGGPTDTIAPTIVSTEQVPDQEGASGPYVVRALILDGMSSDRNFFDKGIDLYYSVDDGPEQQAPMHHSGGQVYRGVIPSVEGGTVSYYVAATDFNNNTGTGEVLSFEVASSQIVILASTPPDGAIDARQPSDLDGSNPAGWDSIDLMFDGDAGSLTPDDFTLTEDGGDGVPVGISSVEVLDATSVRLHFDAMIQTLAWIRVTHNGSGTSVRIGYLPADVSGDGFSGAVDVLTLIDALNGVTLLPDYSTDIDRSGLSSAPDVLREVDLLNGADSYDAYLNASLPD